MRKENLNPQTPKLIMDFISKISNKSDLPERRVWVSIQHGKADYYSNHTAFAKRDVVIAFPTVETAEHFIKHWDSATMSNYKQACLEEDYIFWVILPTMPGSYYADDIRMYAKSVA